MFHPSSITVSAPGSLMLFGEHAVLQGYSGISCAINRRLTVTLTPRTDDHVLIESTLGRFESSLTHLSPTPPFAFLFHIVQHFPHPLSTGFMLQITSEFDDQTGLGSSAAVIVATLAALSSLLQSSLSPTELFALSKKVIQAVQGFGSGCDAAASVLGGIVFQEGTENLQRFTTLPPLVVIYSGKKVPTTQVVQQVMGNPASSSYFAQIESCTLQAKQNLLQKDWQGLGAVMPVAHHCMQALGVSTPLLDHLIDQVSAQPTVYGAKISGSGLGDCVIGIGSLPTFFLLTEEYLAQGVRILPITPSTQGVMIHD